MNTKNTLNIPQILKALGACDRADAYAGMPPTEALAAATASDLHWLCRSVLSPDEQAPYDEAVAPVYRAYDEAVASAYEAVAAAERAYDEAVASAYEAVAPALRAYNEARAPALRAYNEARAPALRAYDEARAAAFRAYDEARAAAARTALLASDWWREVISGS